MLFGGPLFLSLVFAVHIASAFENVQEECRPKMNIVTLLDGSTSVKSNEFRKQKDAVINLVKYFNLDPEAQRVAVVVYSSKVHDVIEFSTDVQSLLSKISRISYPQGKTNTHLGIREMKSMFDTNGRKELEIKKIGIVITDGESEDPSETKRAASESKVSGITMFAVGVGKDVDIDELKAIASSESHVLEATDFDTLKSHLLSILRVICKDDGDWSDWKTITGPCSATCGGGSQSVTQTRTCTNPAPAYGGKACEGQGKISSDEACGNKKCPVDGGWSGWKITDTGTCSASCGGGSQSVTQTRTCTNPAPEHGGKQCKGQETRTLDESCGSRICPVDGYWSNWKITDTGTCSASCGGGSQSVTQTRTCTNPAPAYGGKACEGQGKRSSDEACGNKKCPVDGGWSGWKITDTGTCSASCGGGSQSVTQTRTCTNPAPEHGGKQCKGQETRTLDESCGSRICPVDGDWSNWKITDTGTCSASCGGGSQSVTQTRTCTNPAPAYGGKACEGQGKRSSDEACGNKKCPETQACFEGCKGLPKSRPSAKLLGLKKTLRLKKNALSSHRRKKMSVVGGHSYREMFIAVFIVLWFPVLFLVIWDLMDLMMFILSPDRRRLSAFY